MTPRGIALWMVGELEREKVLYQEVVAYQIKAMFGEKIINRDLNGKLAIDRKILIEFRKLTEETVVWDKSKFCWRFKESDDPPDKRLVD